MLTSASHSQQEPCKLLMLQNHKCHPHGGARKGQGITKIIEIKPLGTMNVCTQSDSNPSYRYFSRDQNVGPTNRPTNQNRHPYSHAASMANKNTLEIRNLIARCYINIRSIILNGVNTLISFAGDSDTSWQEITTFTRLTLLPG